MPWNLNDIKINGSMMMYVTITDYYGGDDAIKMEQCYIT